MHLAEAPEILLGRPSLQTSKPVLLSLQSLFQLIVLRLQVFDRLEHVHRQGAVPHRSVSLLVGGHELREYQLDVLSDEAERFAVAEVAARGTHRRASKNAPVAAARRFRAPCRTA